MLRELNHRNAELDSVNRPERAQRLRGLQAMHADYSQFWSMPGWRGLRVELEHLKAEYHPDNPRPGATERHVAILELVEMEYQIATGSDAFGRSSGGPRWMLAHET